jgi:hypothetical protein
MQVVSSASEEEVISEFLRSEWYNSVYDPLKEKYDILVKNPDLQNTVENETRKYILWNVRGPLLQHIPLDTRWYIASISPVEFSQLLLIRDTAWISTFGEKKTVSDAAQSIVSGVAVDHGAGFDKIDRIKKGIGKKSFQEKIICISSDLDSSLTILEGNHRAVAFQIFANEEKPNNHLPGHIIVGMSPSMTDCSWLNIM